VTLILRLLCGLSPAEIARAFLVDTQTIERRLHRGRARLHELGRLHDVSDPQEVLARQSSVQHALYLLFNAPETRRGHSTNAPLLEPGAEPSASRTRESSSFSPTSPDRAEGLGTRLRSRRAKLGVRSKDHAIDRPASLRQKPRHPALGGTAEGSAGIPAGAPAFPNRGIRARP